MGELKTKKNNTSVVDFLNSIENKEKQEDSFKLLTIFEDITRQKAIMWGDSIIGFGEYHYKSQRSSQEGDWFKTGFSPRKQNLTIYVMAGFSKLQKELGKLGKFKISVGCLYIKKLIDVDLTVLKEIIRKAYELI